MVKHFFYFGLLFFVLTSVLTEVSHAKLFRNSYISFELPENWNCNLEATEWVCRSQEANQTKEAIIILTAKEVGPNDNLPAYESHLKNPKTVISRTGIPQPSKIIHVKQSQINNQIWIDGWHQSSEIPNYYTRYLATAKDQIAILVTFSAHQNHYTKYSQQFFNAINSLRVLATKNLIQRPDLGALRPGEDTLGGNIDGSIADNLDVNPADMKKGKKSKSKNRTIFLLLGLILAAAGAYYYMKSKKK